MLFAARLRPSEAAYSAAPVLRCLAGCVSVTFVTCVQTDNDTAIVAMECE